LREPPLSHPGPLSSPQGAGPPGFRESLVVHLSFPQRPSHFHFSNCFLRAGSLPFISPPTWPLPSSEPFFFLYSFCCYVTHPPSPPHPPNIVFSLPLKFVIRSIIFWKLDPAPPRYLGRPLCAVFLMEFCFFFFFSLFSSPIILVGDPPHVDPAIFIVIFFLPINSFLPGGVPLSGFFFGLRLVLSKRKKVSFCWRWVALVFD